MAADITASEERTQNLKEITNYIIEELTKRNILRKNNSTFQNTESL